MLIKNISKTYGKKLILDDISLEIADGTSVGILGVNGSGKSTLLSCIAKNDELKKSVNIGYIPQENPLFDELKPVDNIRMWTKLNKAQILEALSSEALAPLGITEFINTPVSKMSGGMKKRLSIACALINNPDILLMDEPFASLDLTAKQDILDYMKYFISTGKSIIVASHDEQIFDFCNKVYLLKDCKLLDTNKLRDQGTSYIDMLRN